MSKDEKTPSKSERRDYAEKKGEITGKDNLFEKTETSERTYTPNQNLDTSKPPQGDNESSDNSLE